VNRGGVSCYRKKGEQDFWVFNHSPSDSNRLVDEVFVIYEDVKQRVWFWQPLCGLIVEEDGSRNINDVTF